MPWKWTRTHVRQAELQEYIDAVIRRYDLGPHLRFGASIERVIWDDARQEWAIWSGGEEVLRANYVISSVGLLSDPSIPSWAGMDDFSGPIFHTAQWDHSVDLRNRRVAVVGSGSTAAQVVPALSEIASEVVMFQREPGWVVPKNSRDYHPYEREALDNRVAQRFLRTKFIILRERDQIGGALWREGTPINDAAKAGALAYIHRALEGRPDLIEAVTPKHAFASKRPIISDDLYPALLKPNVTLVPRAVKGVTNKGLIDADGDEHEVDAIVLSTGFKANFITTYDVISRNGRSLKDIWSGDETAFLGIMAEGVPNFFMLYGPNTNGGTIVTNIELQIQYVVRAIKAARKRGASAVEIQPWALDLYDRWVLGRLEGTTFHYENNYYRSGSERIATQWPEGVILYGVLTKILRLPLWKFSYRVGETRGGLPPQVHPEPFRRYPFEVEVGTVR
ncbi:4-hydroxyacetophenone monooxygenase [Frankia sp. CcI49]|nr:4-hydroxyacetophenone monooxygenase [Frankia sp. CcI49]